MKGNMSIIKRKRDDNENIKGDKKGYFVNTGSSFIPTAKETLHVVSLISFSLNCRGD